MCMCTTFHHVILFSFRRLYPFVYFPLIHLKTVLPQVFISDLIKNKMIFLSPLCPNNRLFENKVYTEVTNKKRGKNTDDICLKPWFRPSLKSDPPGIQQIFMDHILYIPSTVLTTEDIVVSKRESHCEPNVTFDTVTK